MAEKVRRLVERPEFRAALIQRHTDLVEQVRVIQERASLAVEQAEVDAAPLVEEAERIEQELQIQV